MSCSLSWLSGEIIAEHGIAGGGGVKDGRLGFIEGVNGDGGWERWRPRERLTSQFNSQRHGSFPERYRRAPATSPALADALCFLCLLLFNPGGE